MAASYKKLWKLLIDRDMNKKDLRDIANVSPTTIAKSLRNESLNTDVLVRSCLALRCDTGDMIEAFRTTEENDMINNFYNKLVRDKIPAIIESDGKTCVCEVLPDTDYYKLLDEKLNEECAEYQESKSPEELADILEVVYAIAATQGLTNYELELLRKDKVDKRGGFVQKILLKEVIEK